MIYPLFVVSANIDSYQHSIKISQSDNSILSLRLSHFLPLPRVPFLLRMSIQQSGDSTIFQQLSMIGHLSESNEGPSPEKVSNAAEPQ